MMDVTETNSTQAAQAPYTLRFTEWRCGHHGTRPDDIPVHSIEQAQAIVRAIGYAISQPGHARAALFDGLSGTTIYLTDDHADTIPSESGWPLRTTVHHATAEELAELLSLQAAFDYCYGGTLKPWDGTAFLDDMEVVTSLTVEAIEAAIAPVEWYEAGQRRAVCDVPPVIKPAAELLAELREADAELKQVDADYAEEGGGA